MPLKQRFEASKIASTKAGALLFGVLSLRGVLFPLVLPCKAMSVANCHCLTLNDAK